MVKYFFWFISNPAILSDQRCKPANAFYRKQKMFQSSFGFRRLYIPDESKRNLQKGLTCTISVYSTSRMVLFRSKRNFKFPFQKIEVFFPHSIRSLWLSKMVYLSWEECKTTDVIERKKKPFKNLVLRQKVEEIKTNISLVFNQQIKFWFFGHKKHNLCKG